jgi:hypothetical protein
MRGQTQHSPEPIWSIKGRLCLLARISGHYELHLRERDRLVRIEICPDERTARRRAAEWHTLYNAVADTAAGGGVARVRAS